MKGPPTSCAIFHTHANHLSEDRRDASIMIALKQGSRNMAQLLVRKIPDDVMDGIRKAAMAEGLSVEEFVRRVLSQQIDHRNRWREFAAWSRKFLAEQQEGQLHDTDTTRMIREDRDNR